MVAVSEVKVAGILRRGKFALAPFPLNRNPAHSLATRFIAANRYKRMLGAMNCTIHLFRSIGIQRLVVNGKTTVLIGR
ncbi:MAG TPA: hypothetical protein DDZ51_30995 [Planctomycetaceae bacterium]|nr:hypothetical protein [Planctomycetaceae bacterium]